MSDKNQKALVKTKPMAVTLPNAVEQPPVTIRAAGRAAEYAWGEFFFGQIRNENTRRAYEHAVRLFLCWCEKRGLELSSIKPEDLGCYLDKHPGSPATKKQHLSAIRHLFDKLVLRHVIILNPALSVRGPKHQIIEGKTREIPVKSARKLLQGFDTSHVVGLRDRSIIGILVYTGARIGAVAKLEIRHLFQEEDQWMLRFEEKGGKSREIPVRHDLQCFLMEYMEAAELNGESERSPLFRSAVGKTKKLNENQMKVGDMGRMLKRRFKDAGLSHKYSGHSFRVTTITDLLEQGVPLEDVQHLAGHADPRTTRLYDRRQKKVTRNIVERISI